MYDEDIHVMKRRLRNTSISQGDGRQPLKKTKPSSVADAKRAYTAAQKSAINSFVSFTSTDPKIAAKVLKSHGWHVENAVNGYFSGPAPTQNNGTRAKLNKQFDELRDLDDPKEYPDTIKINGCMEYFRQLGVSIEGIEMLVVSELLQSPTMGEVTRKGFTEGWSTLGAATLEDQQRRISQTIKSLPSDRTTFARVYKHTFPLGKAEGKKALQLENAIVYWRILFSSAGSPVKWSTPTTPWLDWWIDYLEAEHKKDVNKDLWIQTLKFAEDCLSQEDLSKAKENEAWPAVIDRFMELVEEKRPKPDQDAEDMDYE